MMRWLKHPRAAVILHDLVMVAAAWFIARWLQSEINPVSEWPALWGGAAVLMVLALQAVVLWRIGLYKGLWRFASFPDLWNLVCACTIGGLLITLGIMIVGIAPSSIAATLISYPLALFLLLGVPRMMYRFWKDTHSINHSTPEGRRTLILGAGRSGALLVKELGHRGGFNIVGFLDDDHKLRGAQVHGIPVLGLISHLSYFRHELDAELAIIAMPSATNQQMQVIVGICESADIEFLTLPTLQDLGSKATRIDDLKPVVIDDLLGRDPVSLDWPSIRDGLVGKRVLISGGGGSIGSELCRQIARLDPVELIVVDHSEFNLYQIERELSSDYRDLIHHCVLGDICDPATVEKVVGDYRPDVIFHAAAYKHLPILQNQVREAFRNNVIGTLRISEAAERHGVGTFLLISTDKAVNPTNVMGATKRVAEIYCENMNERSATRFITVRFGNVLNSTGSVVPLFKEQIRHGGPVTVTHPEISRYFMTISEASQLIMQAAVLGSGGEIYVLDMGEPVTITYLAEQLIRLAGKEPGKDIQIIYTGLRPGEKLYEELFHQHEPYAKTSHEKIFLSRHRQADWSRLDTILRESEQAVQRYDTQTLYNILLKLVPEMAQSGSEDKSVVPISRSRKAE
jgi:FlaA1/EpsC-like NDP-sugar epimerase